MTKKWKNETKKEKNKKRKNERTINGIEKER